MTDQISGRTLKVDTASLERIFQHASDAFEERISRYSVGLAFRGREGNPETASAVALKWKQRRVIITAEHVIPRDEEDEGVLCVLPRSRALSRGDH